MARRQKFMFRESARRDTATGEVASSAACAGGDVALGKTELLSREYNPATYTGENG